MFHTNHSNNCVFNVYSIFPFLTSNPIVQHIHVSIYHYGNNIFLSFCFIFSFVCIGYILHYKRESADWEELRLADVPSFMHENLRCGTRYQYYLVGFNSAGKGDPSQVVSARTDGTCKSCVCVSVSDVCVYVCVCFPFL